MLAKVTRGNQVTIPKEIVKQAHIQNGNDYVDVSYEHGVIFLKPVNVEERVPDEVYEKLLRKVQIREKDDHTFSSTEDAITFLKKRAKK